MTRIMSSADLARFSIPGPLEGWEEAVADKTSGVGHAIATPNLLPRVRIVFDDFGDLAEIEDLVWVPGIRYDNAGHHDYDGLSDPVEDLDLVERIGRSSGGTNILGSTARTRDTTLVADVPTDTWDAILSSDDRLFLPLQLHLPFPCL